MTVKAKWLILASSGIVFMGAGISACCEAAVLKGNGGIFLDWFVLGLFGFILFFGGLSIFGEAVVQRVLLIQQAQKK
jgi:hypothetical protein